MRVWIAPVTPTRFSGINTLWAAMTQTNPFIPDCVHLINLVESKKTNFLKKAQTGYHQLLKNYGTDTKPIVHKVDEPETEGDYETIVKRMGEIVSKEKAKGHTIALDMTPGRKYMTAFTVDVATKHNADKIYYLHVKGVFDKRRGQGTPFPLIPSNLVTLYDLLPVLKAGSKK